MEAVRCLRCGETRWTLRPETLARRLASPCEACGGRVVLERRHPGAAHARLLAERRSLAPAHRLGPRAPAGPA